MPKKRTRTKVVYLGPKYTFSHEAASKMFPRAELFYQSSFRDVFGMVYTAQMHYGVLPVENSSTGPIAETFQLLVDQPFEAIKSDVRVKITGEMFIPINHHLLARTKMEVSQLRTLYTHRQPYLQCADWISQNLPNVRIEYTISTADAAEKLLQDSTGACIGSNVLARQAGLVKLSPDIQDFSRNVTRFVSISATHTKVTAACNKSTFAIIIPDKAGTLVRALQLVSAENVNLSSIKTLPIRDSRLFDLDFKDWFVIDIDEGGATPRFQNLVDRLSARRDVILSRKMLGSYAAFPLGPPPREARPTMPTGHRPQEPPSLLDIIAKGESELVEFKATLRYDIKTRGANKELGKVVGKTLAGFMNSDGGYLFIGVADDGEAFGIEKDISLLGKRNEDEFLSTLYQVVLDTIGEEYCQKVHPEFLTYKAKRVCAIRIDRSNKPAWFIDKGIQTFFIRAGNSTRPLGAKDALDYVLEKFRSV